MCVVVGRQVLKAHVKKAAMNCSLDAIFFFSVPHETHGTTEKIRKTVNLKTQSKIITSKGNNTYWHFASPNRTKLTDVTYNLFWLAASQGLRGYKLTSCR